jgi:hypothetical protein
LTIGASDGIGAASGARPQRAALHAKRRRGEKCCGDGNGREFETQIHAPSFLSVSPPLQGRGRTKFSSGLHASQCRFAILHGRMRVGGLLGSFYGDPVRLHLGKLRNCDFQHTIDELRLDVLGIGRIRQAEAALEFTGDALDATIAFARFARASSRCPRMVSTP